MYRRPPGDQAFGPEKRRRTSAGDHYLVPRATQADERLSRQEIIAWSQERRRLADFKRTKAGSSDFPLLAAKGFSGCNSHTPLGRDSYAKCILLHYSHSFHSLHRFEAGGRVMDSSNLSGPNSGDQWTRWTLWPGSGLQSAEVPRSPEVLVKFTPLQHPEQAVFQPSPKTCATPSRFL